MAAKYFKKGELSAWFPSNSMLVIAPGVKVIVDPGDSSKLAASMDPRPDPGRFRPVALASHLSGVGVRPEDVTHVVVTHLHFDHFAGVSVKGPGGWRPAFPRARHIIPRRDWEMPDIAGARDKGDKDVAGTLGAVEKAGLVDLVDGRVDVAPGVAVEPFPGETPGHQVLHVSAAGSHCYCIGDLYHVKEEAVHPELAAVWTDRGSLLESKARFASAASREGAVVLSGHIPPGAVSLAGGKVRWVDL